MTSWTPDVCGVVFTEAHGYPKLAIACLAVIFIIGHGCLLPAAELVAGDQSRRAVCGAAVRAVKIGGS